MSVRYIIKFLEKNKNKSFFTNLKKYYDLSFEGKCKVVSSFLTHLFINREGLRSKKDLLDNEKVVSEVLSILNSLVLYKEDNFGVWLKKVLERSERGCKKSRGGGKSEDDKSNN